MDTFLHLLFNLNIDIKKLISLITINKNIDEKRYQNMKNTFKKNDDKNLKKQLLLH